MLDRWIDTLNDQFDLTADEIADICWLTMVRQSFETSSAAEAERTTKTSSQPIQQVIVDEVQPTASSPPAQVPDVVPPSLVPKPQSGLFSKGQSGLPGLESKPIRIPDAPTIRDALALIKALKPLIKAWEIGPGPELNEAATVQKIAEEQIWWPQTKPLTEPWLELALVVDESESMVLWRRTLRELNRFFKHYGAFRDVRLWGLVTQEDIASTTPKKSSSDEDLDTLPNADDEAVNQHSQHKPEKKLYIRANPFSKLTEQNLRRPDSLVDPSGRRVVVLISDCVADFWRTPQILDVLQLWGTRGPLFILQMMPEWLWHRTGLRQASLVVFKGKTEGSANADLAIARTLSARRQKQLLKNVDIPVPVVTLEPERLAQWTDMITLRGDGEVPGVLFSHEAQRAALTLRQRQQKRQVQQPANATQRTQIFQSSASPMARKLASLLAASPVISLPVVRMVQTTLLPESKPVHVAEVLLGGILQAESAPQVDTNPDDVVYRFVDEGIRTRLLANAPVPDTTAVLSDYIQRRFGKSLHEFIGELRRLMDTEGVAEDEIKPFARVTAAVLQYRGDDPIYNSFVADVQHKYGDDPTEREKDGETDDDTPQREAFPPLQDFDYEAAKVRFDESSNDIVLQTQILEVGILERQDAIDSSTLFEFTTAKITKQRTGFLWRQQQWRIEKSQQQAYQFTELLTTDVSLEMVAILSGRFTMGSPKDEEGYEPIDGPQHEVTVPAFFMAKNPITQAQWRIVAGWEQVNQPLNPEPSHFGNDRDNRDKLPVEQVSWKDAMEFCARLSERTGRTYTLPSEAQWEYACRAGTTTPFYFGETLSAELANYNSSASYNNGPTTDSPERTVPVGQFYANDFGLYDMHGNVWEWCLDDWHDNYEEAPADGSAWLFSDSKKSGNKVLRGGSWIGDPAYCRSACRFNHVPDIRYDLLGFRVVCLPQGS